MEGLSICSLIRPISDLVWLIQDFEGLPNGPVCGAGSPGFPGVKLAEFEGWMCFKRKTSVVLSCFNLPLCVGTLDKCRFSEVAFSSFCLIILSFVGRGGKGDFDLCTVRIGRTLVK